MATLLRARWSTAHRELRIAIAMLIVAMVWLAVPARVAAAAVDSSIVREFIKLRERVAAGDANLSAELAERAVLARRTGDKRALLAAVQAQAMASLDSHGGVTAPDLEEAIGLANEFGDMRSKVLLMAALGRLRVVQGDPAGEGLAKAALVEARVNGLDEVVPYLNVWSAAAQIRLNRGAEGIRLLLEAYNAFTAAGDRVAIVYTLCDIAEALRAPEWASAEDLQKAQGYLNEGLALVDRARQPALLLWLTEGLALTAQRQGKLEDSFEHLKEARRMMEAGIDPDNLSWVQYRMGSVLLGMGRSEVAPEKWSS